jgi:tetratricopeptide (TPR) repeat protein
MNWATRFGATGSSTEHRAPDPGGWEGRQVGTVASDTRWLIQRGTAAFRARAYAEAEASLLEAVARDAHYANVYHMLGVIASQRGAPERAIELFRRALALNPRYSEAQLNLAITLTETGAYDQAANEMGHVQAREPVEAGRPGAAARGALANAHADLARKYHALGMYADAVGEYDKAIRLCPDFADLHHARAVTCREMGDHAGATAAVARALELNPRYVEAHVTRGSLHQRTGQAAAAIAAWQRALALDPGHKLARLYLAQATASRAAET